MAGTKVGRFEKDFSTGQEHLRYYYQDQLGSRIGVTDETGAILATIRYDVWGKATATGSSGYDAEGEIRFTGKPGTRRGCTTSTRGTTTPRARGFSRRTDTERDELVRVLRE